uniref:Cytochrome c oxidase subunit 3 n=1 Tax=Cyclophorus martensianus TaxID=494924 RepID=A0A4P8VV51_9CAEN|nr:cytochrome c oxidase subunit III [Cyclophorus martensianus]
MVRNPFPLVEYSPWPLIGFLGAFFLTLGLVSWFPGLGYFFLTFGVIIILVTMLQWGRDVFWEGTFQGHHSSLVMNGLRWGMILFITSEVCFFFAFFWAYFHSSLAPTVEVGACWPPVGILPLNPFEVPLLNTGVLLSSGVTVTWAHHSLMAGNFKAGCQSLFMTVVLGFYFTFLQGGEYLEASFTIADGSYGSTFFVATGFHGLHVLIGSFFLVTCLLRVWFHHFF